MCNRGFFGSYNNGCGCGNQGNRSFDYYNDAAAYSAGNQSRGTLFIGFGRAFVPAPTSPAPCSGRCNCNCGSTTVNVLPASGSSSGGCRCCDCGCGRSSWNGWCGNTWMGGCL